MNDAQTINCICIGSKVAYIDGKDSPKSRARLSIGTVTNIYKSITGDEVCTVRNQKTGHEQKSVDSTRLLLYPRMEDT
jgi:hypothetical protein